ncbi:MAG: hypothetical protein RI917_811 [Actinomycetota bacterium]|jgi:transcriptional regulator with XRE-family HTH domain
MADFDNIRELRRSLGLSSSKFAELVGKSGANIRYLEQAEITGAASLASLADLAAAIGYELQISYTPKEPESILEAMANRKAEAVVRRVQSTMALESQDLSEQQLERLKQQVLAKLRANPKLAWQ